MKTKIVGCLMLAAITTTAAAQGGTNSPYSQFGLGVLSDQSQSASRGMNGTGIALRVGNQANTLNPASYSAVDSLTMIFDMGMAGQLTNYKEGATRVNAKSANFEYAVGLFRAAKNVGISFGVLPYSNIGYSYSSESDYLSEFDAKVPATYSGDGGLRKVFLGVGWRLLKPLSLGVNVAYLWGSYDHTIQTTSVSNINSTLKTYSASVSSYQVDMGLQFEQPVSKKDVVTVGATVGLGHKLHANPEYQVQVGSNTARTFTVENGLELPMSYGVGLAYNHARRLTVAVDGLLQQWGELKFPAFNTANNQYELTDGLLKDRIKVNGGIDYVPDSESLTSYLKHVHYRIGAGYSTPYYNINGFNAPKELSVSVGLGLPLVNFWNNRSVLNISGQWSRCSSDRFITENTFRINIGITFNEKWFAKWKVE